VLKGLNPEQGVSIVEAGLSDPADYAEILSALRSKLLPALDLFESPTDLSVAVASATPQMHAAWLLLVASGEIHLPAL
jgi:hypothetical protein